MFEHTIQMRIKVFGSISYDVSFFFLDCSKSIDNTSTLLILGIVVSFFDNLIMSYVLQGGKMLFSKKNTLDQSKPSGQNPRKSVSTQSQGSSVSSSVSSSTQTKSTGEKEMAKQKSPSEVLQFYKSSKGRYMGHFFHFQDDEPTIKEVFKKDKAGNRKKDENGKELPAKIEITTKKEQLRLVDVEKIFKQQEKLKTAKMNSDLDEIAKSVLEVDLQLELVKAGLDIEEVLIWAKAEAEKELDSSKKTTSKPSKEGKLVESFSRGSEEQKLLTIINSVFGLYPKGETKISTPEKAVEKLEELLENHNLVNKVIEKLKEYENKYHRDEEEKVKSNGKDVSNQHYNMIFLRNMKKEESTEGTTKGTTGEAGEEASDIPFGEEN